MSGKHRTTWEDDQMAGFTCDGKDSGGTVVADEDRTCSRCGAVLRLHWSVYIAERLPTPPHDGEVEPSGHPK